MRVHERSEIRNLERNRSLFITFDGSKYPKLVFHSCEFEGGRIVASNGGIRIFSGPPPRVWDLRLPSPLPSPTERENPREIGDALTALANRFGGRARLHYSEISAVRFVMGTTLSPLPRLFSVWALTGFVATPSGRMIPIGWSGRGSGLACLWDDRAGELLEWKVKAVDQAQSPDSGMLPALLSPHAAAVILHEAIGHFAEGAADGGTNLDHRLGRRIASEIFSLNDNPLAVDGPAYYKFDDEGVTSFGPTEIVCDGVLVAQLHSLSSARRAGVLSTANGRAVSTWSEPIPRISNLICAPGSASEDELIENVGTGLYIHQLADGFVLGARVEARVVLAERISRGRRTQRFLTGGNVKEQIGLLTRGVQLGDQSVYSPNALCGKAGQLLFNVGTCAPAIQLSTLRIIA